MRKGQVESVVRLGEVEGRVVDTGGEGVGKGRERWEAWIEFNISLLWPAT